MQHNNNLPLSARVRDLLLSAADDQLTIAERRAQIVAALALRDRPHQSGLEQLLTLVVSVLVHQAGGTLEILPEDLLLAQDGRIPVFVFKRTEAGKFQFESKRP